MWTGHSLSLLPNAWSLGGEACRLGGDRPDDRGGGPSEAASSLRNLVVDTGYGPGHQVSSP